MAVLTDAQTLGAGMELSSTFLKIVMTETKIIKTAVSIPVNEHGVVTGLSKPAWKCVTTVIP